MLFGDDWVMTGPERASSVRNGAGTSERGAVAWLLHPVIVVAVAVLLLNDHVLKAAWPGMLTGKLSDVAGLALAPPVITATVALLVPRLPVRVVAGTATVAVGMLFALVKTTAAGAAAASAMWSWAWGPSTVLRDPTDLLALPALAVSWWAFGYVTRHPLPRRAVDLVRLVIVLPTAGLAILATSAVDYPWASDVIVRQGTLIVTTGMYDHAISTTDGESWSDLTERSLSGDTSRNSARPPACVPADPRHCYRTVPGRLAVEESVDGGGTWTGAWSISPGRLRFLQRAYPGHRADLTDVTATAVGVLPVGSRYLVAVAAGRDGVLVRHLDGRWERIGFPTAESRDFVGGTAKSPAALTAPGQRIAREFISVTMSVSLGLLLGGLAASPRAWRNWWVIPLISVLFGYGVAMAGGLAAVLGASSVPAAVVLAVIALLTWVIIVYSSGALSIRRAVVLGVLGAIVVVVGTYPFVEWSAGQIDSYEVAVRAAAYLVGGGIVVMTLVGLGFTVFDRPRRQDAPVKASINVDPIAPSQ